MRNSQKAELGAGGGGGGAGMLLELQPSLRKWEEGPSWALGSSALLGFYS